MDSVGGDQGRQTSIRQAVSASIVGSVLEWYDFSLYGLAAAVIFNKLFFPGSDPLVGTLLAFGTYAVGFFARPFGGLFFGHLGDRVGRRTVLLLTVGLMGIATFGIGLLPSYGQVGVLAPILLLVLRILQGFGGGAEQSGAVLLVTEYAPTNRRGFYASLPFIGITFGILLSAGIFRLITLLPEDALLSWGWRIPFLLSIVVVGVGIYIRLNVLETPVFEEVKEAQAEAALPVAALFRESPRNFLLAFGARFAENGSSYLFQVFVLTYITQLGFSEGVGLTGILLAAAFGMFTLPLFGALSDRVGRRPVYMGAAAFLVLFAFPYFWLLDTGVSVLIWVAIILSYAVGTYGMLAPQSSFFPELFNARYRYSGVALSRELSAPVAGGNLKAHVRMDTANVGSITISINKAYTAIAFQGETRDLTDDTRPDGPIYGLSDAHGGRLAIFPGGIPLVRDGAIVGAIGVSTGTVDQDQEVASAGAAAF